MRLQLLLIAAVTSTAALAQNTSIDGATHADWPSYGGTTAAWRYSGLDQINTSNVRQLAPAWIYQTGDYTDGLQSTPIVIGGRMYISTPHQVDALDATTGKLLWHHRITLRPNFAKAGSQGSFVQSRGVAVGDGKVFMGTADSFLLALDEKTGAEVWRVAVDDSRQCGCNIPEAPLVVKDKVVVGQSGGDGAIRGYVTAFYMKTGRMAWRTYTIPGPGEKNHDTWKGDSWKTGGGATWMTGSFDPGLNMVYWGTGNAAEDFYAGNRLAENDEGANLYTASVLGLDADTGKIIWHYQEIPNDVWDFDSVYESILVDRQVKGQMRKLLIHMNKSGLTFVLDRTNGKFVGVFSTPEVQTWITGVTETGQLVGRRDPELNKATNVCPNPVGAKSWNQMAYSPKTGYIYTPLLEMCGDLAAIPGTPTEGRFFTGGSWVRKLPPNRTTYGHVDAWDPITGKKVWTFPIKYPTLASVLATAGDLIFSGDPEGNFFALDAKSGKQLWNFNTGAGHRGSAVSYSVNGRQYIATPTGWGSITGPMVSSLFPDEGQWRGGSSLMVFALPEGTRK